MAQGSLFYIDLYSKNTLEYFPLILEDLKLHDAQVSAIGPMVLLFQFYFNCQNFFHLYMNLTHTCPKQHVCPNQDVG